MGDKNGKEADRQPEGQVLAQYEYSTLMNLLDVSISKHLLDEHFTLI